MGEVIKVDKKEMNLLKKMIQIDQEVHILMIMRIKKSMVKETIIGVTMETTSIIIKAMIINTITIIGNMIIEIIETTILVEKEKIDSLI